MANERRKRASAEEKTPMCCWWAMHRSCALIRVRGRWIFQGWAGPQTVRPVGPQQECRESSWDMDECTAWTATFMGVLAGLALRLKHEGRGRMLMMNLCPRP